jgi:DNA-binding PadR family transcriptional regulator
MKFSEIQKATAETLDHFHDLGWIVYYDDTKQIFRLTEMGKKALEFLKDE